MKSVTKEQIYMANVKCTQSTEQLNEYKRIPFQIFYNVLQISALGKFERSFPPSLLFFSFLKEAGGRVRKP